MVASRCPRPHKAPLRRIRWRPWGLRLRAKGDPPSPRHCGLLVGRDEGDPEWAKLIDTSLAKDPPTELAPDKDDTGSGTENTGSGTAIGRDEENTEWADMIDVSLAPDLPPTDVTPKESDTEKADMLALAESIEGAAVIQIASGDREPSRRLSEIGKRWIVDGLRLLAGSGVGDAH